MHVLFPFLVYIWSFYISYHDHKLSHTMLWWNKFKIVVCHWIQELCCRIVQIPWQMPFSIHNLLAHSSWSLIGYQPEQGRMNLLYYASLELIVVFGLLKLTRMPYFFSNAHTFSYSTVFYLFTRFRFLTVLKSCQSLWMNWCNQC